MLSSTTITSRGLAAPRPSAVNLRRAVDGAFGLLTVVLSLITVAFLAGLLLGFRVYVVQTGSMAPDYPPGSVVVDRVTPAMDLAPGDVITFRYSGIGGQLVTHRIVSMYGAGDRLHVVTRGDANISTEHWSVSTSASLSRVLVGLNGVGNVLLASKSSGGRVAEAATVAIWAGYATYRVRAKRSGPRPGVTARSRS